jgi:serine protease Do
MTDSRRVGTVRVGTVLAGAVRVRAALAGAAALISATAAPARAQGPSSLAELSETLEAMAQRVAPAVVQIFSEGWTAGAGYSSESLLERRQSSGSGVLLDADGTLVTNAHVVAGARRVRVLLGPPADRPEGHRSILQGPGPLLGAQILGTDEETDLAVLRIQGSGLPFLRLGDSDEVRQGQLVFAFGSPLGLPNSLSMGIVSSTARQLGPDDPMIYVQTDAPINPGNSGGPLVNAAGEVIGINTLIFSQSGGSEGIGFAAPSNIVASVVDQIRRNGRVRRGEIGVRAQSITPGLAQALELGASWGVVLGDVRPGGPADRAGLRAGDIIASLDGKTMENARQLDVNLYGRPVGSTVTLGVIRAGDPRTFDVEVIERRESSLRFTDLVSPERNLVAEIGVLALDLDPEVRKLLPQLRHRNGVLVAARAVDALPGDGFQPGDVIHALNGRAVDTLSQLREQLQAVPAGEPVALHVERAGEMLYVSLHRR